MFADVTSANVVGYNQRAMEFDLGLPEYLAPSFDAVGDGTGTYTLSQIVPVGEWDPTADNIATIDPYGCQNFDEMFVYFEGDWYFYLFDESIPDFDRGPQNDYVLDTNHGLIVSVTDPSTVLQFAGSVQKGEAEMFFDDETGMPTYTGNFTAAPLKLGDMVPGGDGEWDPTADNIATIDPYGCQNFDEMFTYFEGDWYYYLFDESIPDFDRGSQNDYEIPANKGLILTITAGAALNVAMPLVD